MDRTTAVARTGVTRVLSGVASGGSAHRAHRLHGRTGGTGKAATARTGTFAAAIQALKSATAGTLTAGSAALESVTAAVTPKVAAAVGTVDPAGSSGGSTGGAVATMAAGTTSGTTQGTTTATTTSTGTATAATDPWTAIDSKLLTDPYGSPAKVLGVPANDPTNHGNGLDLGPEQTLPNVAYAGTVAASTLTSDQASGIAYETPEFATWAQAQSLDTLYGTVNNLANAYRFNAYAGDPADLADAINTTLSVMYQKQLEKTGQTVGQPDAMTFDQFVSGMGTFKNAFGNQIPIYGLSDPDLVANSVYPMQGGAYGQYTPGAAANAINQPLEPGQQGYYAPPGTPIGAVPGPGGLWPGQPGALPGQTYDPSTATAPPSLSGSSDPSDTAGTTDTGTSSASTGSDPATGSVTLSTAPSTAASTAGSAGTLLSAPASRSSAARISSASRATTASTPAAVRPRTALQPGGAGYEAARQRALATGDLTWLTGTK